jgi:hypothetical protein
MRKICKCKTIICERILAMELTKFSAPGRLALLARFTASSRLFNCRKKDILKF